MFDLDDKADRPPETLLLKGGLHNAGGRALNLNEPCMAAIGGTAGADCRRCGAKRGGPSCQPLGDTDL